MRQYYTLTQSFAVSSETKSLGPYLDSQDIKYNIGLEQAEDLYEFGFRNSVISINATMNNKALVKKYVVLLEEHELTAIKLCVDGVMVIANRRHYDMLNRVRGYFK